MSRGHAASAVTVLVLGIGIGVACSDAGSGGGAGADAGAVDAAPSDGTAPLDPLTQACARWSAGGYRSYAVLDEILRGERGLSILGIDPRLALLSPRRRATHRRGVHGPLRPQRLGAGLDDHAGVAERLPRFGRAGHVRRRERRRPRSLPGPAWNRGAERDLSRHDGPRPMAMREPRRRLHASLVAWAPASRTRSSARRATRPTGAAPTSASNAVKPARGRASPVRSVTPMDLRRSYQESGGRVDASSTVVSTPAAPAARSLVSTKLAGRLPRSAWRSSSASKASVGSSPIRESGPSRLRRHRSSSRSPGAC